MMRIGILGATSHIAKDFIISASDAGYALSLFSRRPKEVSDWIKYAHLDKKEIFSAEYDLFSSREYDAIINFVGSGDPARTNSMGAEIIGVTRKFDDMATDYLSSRPQTRYIFISSGAVYGTAFSQPVTESSQAQISINNISPQDYYSIAKLYAEVCHRALAPQPIVDVRVFNYFSHTADISARFFLTEVMRALKDNHPFETNEGSILRDFIGPEDFFSLIDCILRAPSQNTCVDVYSRKPIEKFELLRAMEQEFGLVFKVVPLTERLASFGSKYAYCSSNPKARDFGYEPQYTSLECIIKEGQLLLRK